MPFWYILSFFDHVIVCVLNVLMNWTCWPRERTEIEGEERQRLVIVDHTVSILSQRCGEEMHWNVLGMAPSFASPLMTKSLLDLYTGDRELHWNVYSRCYGDTRQGCEESEWILTERDRQLLKMRPNYWKNQFTYQHHQYTYSN